MRSFLFVSWIVMAAACGGASSAPSATDSSSAAEDAVSDPTEGGRRRAESGARCDFGGIADMTCVRPLTCCYGPPENPGDYGTCLAACPN